ncbi:hypothetical protein PG985_003736 [Apiospora marii]|uniref:Uncharacterized protein n=1 Tax=Apiospora marii TaxID=335849 RepID=A0ABR1SH79_9PEZI
MWSLQSEDMLGMVINQRGLLPDHPQGLLRHNPSIMSLIAVLQVERLKRQQCLVMLVMEATSSRPSILPLQSHVVYDKERERNRKGRRLKIANIYAMYKKTMQSPMTMVIHNHYARILAMREACPRRLKRDMSTPMSPTSFTSMVSDMSFQNLRVKLTAEFAGFYSI